MKIKPKTFYAVFLIYLVFLSKQGVAGSIYNSLNHHYCFSRISTLYRLGTLPYESGLNHEISFKLQYRSRGVITYREYLAILNNSNSLANAEDIEENLYLGLYSEGFISFIIRSKLVNSTQVRMDKGYSFHEGNPTQLVEAIVRHQIPTVFFIPPDLTTNPGFTLDEFNQIIKNFDQTSSILFVYGAYTKDSLGRTVHKLDQLPIQ